MNRHQTTLGLAGYLLIGTAAVLIPSVMASITTEFMAAGLTLAAIGLIFPVRAVGGLLGNLLAGVGSDLLGRGRLVWLAALLLGLALLLAAATGQWLIFVMGLLIISGAQSALSTGINAMIADANREARARALNTLHGVYGVGAAISPLFIGDLLGGGLPWRWALGGSGLIWLIYGVVVYLFYRGENHAQDRTQTQQTEWQMLREGPFLALFLIAFAYNGIAWSLLGWIAVFMEQSAGLSTFLSISMIAVFYVALTIGRFLCAAYAERIGYTFTLLILGIGITLTYGLVVFGTPVVVAVGVFLTGLSLSGLFPTALALGAQRYPEQTGTVSGILSIAMTIGSMIPPLWTGIIAERWNFQVALGVNYIMVVPLIFLALYLGRQERVTIQPINDAVI